MMAASLAFNSLVEAAKGDQPELALILGSGMSQIARRLKRTASVSFHQIPGLVPTSVPGHEGSLSLGEWSGRRLLVFDGRLHYYEGHPWATVTRPISIAHSLGVRTLLLTNAAGGIHPGFVPGSLMLVRDHVEWTRPYSWRYPGVGGLGSERPSPYSSGLRQRWVTAGRKQGEELHQGIYAAVTGPNYETRAEIRALKQCGADAVGMSTAREIQAGTEFGMECAAICCITNRAAGLGVPIHHNAVLATATATRERLADLIEAFLES